MVVKKAVLGVAGWSTRMLPTVKAYAKHLVPVVDRPQIQWVVEELLEAGLEEMIVVHRPGDDSFQRYFDNNNELEEYLKRIGKESYMESWRKMMKRVKRWRFVPQAADLPYGNGTPIWAVEKYLDNEPFVYVYADDMVIESKVGGLCKEVD